MNEETTPVKGRARILIDDAVVALSPTRIEKPQAGEVLWDMMETRELFDLFTSFLQLPETHTITGVFFDVVRFTWTIIVESEALPVRDLQGEELPVLLPHYQRTEDGRTRLVDLQLV
jgi:hypothetical protein